MMKMLVGIVIPLVNPQSHRVYFSEYLTGFRKRKQERRRIAKEAITEKDRIARREAKKQRKLEMLRAYGIDVQEHVVPAAADGICISSLKRYAYVSNKKTRS